MKWKYILAIMIFLPSIILALQITEESARMIADLVVVGKVQSICRYSTCSEYTEYYSAKVQVVSQHKGPILNTNILNLVYETPSCRSGSFVARCPPFVALSVNQVVIFAIITNNAPPSISFFLPSSDFVDTDLGHITNANNGVHGSLAPHLRSKASTTNLCEGLFSQVRYRINQIGAFDNPIAVEKFVFAVICQKDWINVPGRISDSPLLNVFTHNS